MRHEIFGAFLLAIVAVASTQSFAEDVWIKSDNVQIRGGKGAAYPIIAAAAKGTRLSVLTHDHNWLKVKVEDTEGYVYQDSISTESVSGDGAPLLRVAAGGDSSVLSSGSATRGLQPGAIAYSQSHNKAAGADRLNAIIALRNRITPQQWESFTSTGNIGPAAP